MLHLLTFAGYGLLTLVNAGLAIWLGTQAQALRREQARLREAAVELLACREDLRKEREGLEAELSRVQSRY